MRTYIREQREPQGGRLQFCPTDGAVDNWLCEPLFDGSGLAKYTCPDCNVFTLIAKYWVKAKPSEAEDGPRFKA